MKATLQEERCKQAACRICRTKLIKRFTKTGWAIGNGLLYLSLVYCRRLDYSENHLRFQFFSITFPHVAAIILEFVQIQVVVWVPLYLYAMLHIFSSHLALSAPSYHLTDPVPSHIDSLIYLFCVLSSALNSSAYCLRIKK